MLLILVLLPFFTYSQPNGSFKAIKVDSIVSHNGHILKFYDSQTGLITLSELANKNSHTAQLFLSLYLYTSWGLLILGVLFVLVSFVKHEKYTTDDNKSIRTTGFNILIIAVVLLLAWYFPVV